jgi:hypothetical protein
MHPRELLNQALAAASVAEREGFIETARAFKALVEAIQTEERVSTMGENVLKDRILSNCHGATSRINH